MPRTQKVDRTPGEIKSASTSRRSGHIVLGLISLLPDDVLSSLSAHLRNEFGVPVENLKLDQDVSFSFSRKRNQYSSPKILDKLKQVHKRPDDKILGIVDVDLFCPDYDFLFGEADAAAGVATLSTHRLKQATNDGNLIASRIIKEATHEIGHLFNLGHCDDPYCVMSFSTGNLWQIDSKSASICPECHTRVELPVRGTVHN